jgi:catechol 2,3-dioxygenase-like lactoylglutathione lyase family enzyme
MDESLAFFRDFVGMSVVGENRLDSSILQKIWALPDDATAKVVFLKMEEQPTLLELIQFKPHSGKHIRDNAKNWDYGIFDVAFTVRDLEKTFKILTEKGYSFPTPPTPYTPTFSPGLKVLYSICMGPNKMPIPHFQYLEPAPPVMKKDYGRIVDSAQIVEDMDEALRFYRDILKLAVLSDAPFPAGLLDELLGLPAGTEGRIVLLNMNESQSPLVELIQLSEKGTSLADRAVPQNIGVFMIAFETKQLDELHTKLKTEGYKILTAPTEVELSPYGRIRLIIVEGPSMVNVEFFELG